MAVDVALAVVVIAVVVIVAVKGTDYSLQCILEFWPDGLEDGVPPAW